MSPELTCARCNAVALRVFVTFTTSAGGSARVPVMVCQARECIAALGGSVIPPRHRMGQWDAARPAPVGVDVEASE